MNRPIWFWLIAISSVCLLILLFIPGLGESFLPIDDDSLFASSLVKNPWHWNNFLGIFTPGFSSDYYPIRDLSVWLDWTFAKQLATDTTVAKVQNIAWLLGIGYLTYLVLVHITNNSFLSVLFASGWLLHPFHFESLHWISSRKDLMAWFFTLLSGYYFMKIFESVHLQKWRHYCTALILFVCGMLSKATFLAFPFVIFVWLLWQRRAGKHKHRSNLDIAVGLACVLALGLLLLNFWNYTQSNPMKLNEGFTVWVLSVFAALGRNTLGVFLPFPNGIDIEPWGGWYLYNQSFVPMGIVSAILFISLFAIGVYRRSASSLLFLLLIFAILAMTPGFNPNHRSYYSVRYFEPIFWVLFIWTGIAISKLKRAVPLAVAFWLLISLTAIWDSPNWHSNLAILQKSYTISKNDPSTRAMLLTEYHSLMMWGRLNLQEVQAYRELYQLSIEECVASEEVNGRCLSFLTHIRDLASHETKDIQYAYVIKSVQKIIAIKTSVFSDVANAELAWSLFQFNQFTNRVFDVSLLREHFKGHPFFMDGNKRVHYLLLQCLDVSPVQSQKRLQEWVDSGLMNSSDVKQFIADLGDPALTKTAQNCFKTPK